MRIIYTLFSIVGFVGFVAAFIGVLTLTIREITILVFLAIIWAAIGCALSHTHSKEDKK